MIDTSNVKTALASLISHAVVFAAAWFYQADKFGQLELARLATNLETATALAAKLEKANSSYNKESAKVQTRTVTKLIEVPKVVEHIVYQNTCIDERGLELINAD